MSRPSHDLMTHMLGESIKYLRSRHAMNLASLKKSLASLKKQNGDYADEHRKLIALHEDIVAVIDLHATATLEKKPYTAAARAERAEALLADRDAEIERLREELAVEARQGGTTNRLLIGLRDQRDRTEALLAEAVKVLGPFAKLAADALKTVDDLPDDRVWYRTDEFAVRIGDLRAARSLLARIKGA